MRKSDLVIDKIRVKHVRNSKYGKKHNKIARKRIKAQIYKEQND